MQLVMMRDKFNDWHSLLPQCLALGPERGPDTISNCKFHCSESVGYFVEVDADLLTKALCISHTTPLRPSYTEA